MMASPQRYCFNIRPHNDGTAQPQEASCSSDRIKQIEQRSVVLQQRIKDPGNHEGIPLETDDAADIDFNALRFLVEDLPLSSGTNIGPVKADLLSKHCSAFWKYQWMPESASTLWENLDQSELEAQSEHGTSPQRCWQQKTSTQSQERSLYLINIAIVFGLDESLREAMDRELRLQIRTAVWNPNLDAQLRTSVKFLHNIEDIRRKELETVFTYFFDYFVHLSEDHSKNVTQVRNRLKAKMEVNFYENWSKNMENGGRLTTYSVYEFVGKIEYEIIGSHEGWSHESGHSVPKAVYAPRKPKAAPDVDWAAFTKAAAKGVASYSKKGFWYLSGSHEPQWRSEIQKMFDGAQCLIEERQKMRADEMIGLRNAELEKWKTALQDETGTS